MARGGKRSGAPGSQYSNRSDLQQGPRLAPTAQTAQPYGQAGQQLQRQSVIPMSAPPSVSPTANNTTALGSALPPPIPLSAPTGRPNEPVQAGIPSGPGPNTSTNPAASIDPVEAQLRGLYMQYPNRDLASLLEMLDKGQTF